MDRNDELLTLEAMVSMKEEIEYLDITKETISVALATNDTRGLKSLLKLTELKLENMKMRVEIFKEDRLPAFLKDQAE